MELSKTGLSISTLRKQNDMTQKELAEKIGVADKATLIYGQLNAGIEKGLKSPVFTGFKPSSAKMFVIYVFFNNR